MDELSNVKGFGAKTVEKLRPEFSIGRNSAPAEAPPKTKSSVDRNSAPTEGFPKPSIAEWEFVGKWKCKNQGLIDISPNGNTFLLHTYRDNTDIVMALENGVLKGGANATIGYIKKTESLAVGSPFGGDECKKQ